MKRLFIFIIIIVLLGSCKKEPSNTSTSMPEYIKWEFVLPEDDDFTTIYDPILYENLVIFPLQDQGIILALNKDTGEEVWRWTEARDTYNGADGFGKRSYRNGNLLLIGQRNLLFAIDLNEGKTVWHRKDDVQYFNDFFGYDSQVGIVSRIPDEKISYGILDIHSGDITYFLEFEREDQYNLAGKIPIIYEHNSNMFVTFVFVKWLSSQDGYQEFGWLYNYDLTNNSLMWVSDSIPKNSPILPVAGGIPVIEESKIVIGSNSIQGYNVESGNLDWIDQSHTNTFVWSTSFTAADGKVFGNNENGYMIALDVNTGVELWRTDTGGTGSRIEYYDDKVYINEITRAGMSYLMVLDANTGEILHDIPSPYEIFGENYWYWDDVITVDQETRLIYTADHNKVMCIELD